MSKFEQPRQAPPSVSTETIWDGKRSRPAWQTTGTDAMCRPGRARFRIVRFMGPPWDENALDVASGRVRRRPMKACTP